MSRYVCVSGERELTQNYKVKTVSFVDLPVYTVGLHVPKITKSSVDSFVSYKQKCKLLSLGHCVCYIHNVMPSL